MLPSAANDLAFSQSMVDSLNRLKDDGTIDDFAMSENMFVVEDAATAIRDYADQGYDLVIAHGSQYGSSLEEIAPDYPDTAFAWGTAADTFGLPNVSGYTAAADQGGYVNGAMAAMLAGDGSLGVIGPIEVGDGKLYVDGFEAGAHSVDPDIEVGINYTESFSDTALAAEAATSFIDGGATVLSGTAQMTVGAIGVAKDRACCGSAPTPTRPSSPRTSSWPARCTTGKWRCPSSSPASRPARSAGRPTTSTSATAAR